MLDVVPMPKALSASVLLSVSFCIVHFVSKCLKVMRNVHDLAFRWIKFQYGADVMPRSQQVVAILPPVVPSITRVDAIMALGRSLERFLLHHTSKIFWRHVLSPLLLSER